MSAPWLVIRIKPQQDLRAATNIHQQGAECYVPRGLIRSQRTHLPRAQSLFPGYGFVRHPDGLWTFLRSTFGVTDVMMGTGTERPALVPNAELARLRAREGPDGLVRLEASEFRLGEKVRVDGGIMSGLTGIIDGTPSRERVYVLLQFLGGLTRTEIDVKDISCDV